MKSKFWDLKTSIGDWACRRWVLCILLVIVLNGCSTAGIGTKKDIGRVCSSKFHYFDIEFLYTVSEIVTDSTVVRVMCEPSQLPLGTHIWIRKARPFEYVDYETITGARGSYLLWN